jgi:hypothetical protein
MKETPTSMPTANAERLSAAEKLRDTLIAMDKKESKGTHTSLVQKVDSDNKKRCKKSGPDLREVIRLRKVHHAEFFGPNDISSNPICPYE